MGKLLITGALGHIGSRLIRGIGKDRFEEVILLDNLSTQRYCSLFNLPEGVPFRFVEGDILDVNLNELLAGVTMVIHLAAITNAADSFAMGDAVERVNFEGTKRIAEACMKRGIKMIFSSTTSVYGVQEEVVDEDCSEEGLQPQSPYATSKLKAEKLLQEYGRVGGLRFVLCRFGTIFGTSIGMRFHTAVNKFCWQACMGQPITVWKTALNQRRPYLDLTDCVRAIWFIIDSDRFDGQIYNVLTTNTTVGEIVEAIRKHVPDLKVTYVESQIMNQLSYTVRTDKFKALGFTYEGELARGIEETIRLLKGT